MNDFRTNIRFRLHGKVIETSDIDFSGRIEQQYAGESYQVWVKLAGTCWSGRGMPRTSVPAETWLVKTEGDRATILEECRGKSQKTIDALIERAKIFELPEASEVVGKANSPASIPTFQSIPESEKSPSSLSGSENKSNQKGAKENPQ